MRVRKKKVEKKTRVKKEKVVEEPDPEDFPSRVQTAWKIGAHVSAAGGVENAVVNAAKLGCVSARRCHACWLTSLQRQCFCAVHQVAPAVVRLTADGAFESEVQGADA
jgi:hypothetical protein